jgi:hypothetical protein
VTQPQRFPISKIILALAIAALVILFGIVLSNYFGLARQALTFPYPLDYGEGPLLDQVLRIGDGENIYHNDFSVPPYNISNYPPVFLLAQVPFAKIFGPAFWYGRAISVLCALLTALFIGLTLRTLTGEWLGPLAGALTLLAFPYIQEWSLYNRIDTLALALSWGALLVTVRWSEKRWSIPLAALLLILSIYTRQSYALAAPAGAFFWLLAMRRWRKALLLALITGGAGLALFLLINLVTRGGFFLNIVTANVNPFYWDSVRWNWQGLYGHCYFLMALAVVYLVGERFTGHSRAWPLALPYLVGGALTALTIGKDGSNVNYLYELAAALSLVAGAALAWIRRYPWVRTAALAMLFLQVGIMLAWTQEDFNNHITGKTENETQIARLYQVVRDTDGIILADEYMGLLPLAGKRIYYQPFEFKMLAEGGLWDEEQFMIEIIDHKFSAVLWYEPPTWDSISARWTRKQRSAINAAYKLDNSIATTSIMVPRK